MLAAEVTTRMGPPATVGGDKDEVVWGFDGVAAVLRQGAVSQLAGTELTRGDQVVLRLGDSRRKAESLLGANLCKVVFAGVPVRVEASGLGDKIRRIAVQMVTSTR